MKKIIVIIILLSQFFLGCKKAQKSIEIDDGPKKCFSPLDAIFKFKTLKKTILVEKFSDFLKENELENFIDNSKIKEWIKSDVFGVNSATEYIVEWDINDSDFCEERRTIIIKANDSVKDTVSIKVCNSILNEGVIPGGYWDFNQKHNNSIISISFCSKIIKTLNRVGYYEVIKKSGKLKFNDYNTDKLKHLTLTDVYVSFHDYENKIYVRKKVFTDKAFLFSAAENFSESDYLEKNEFNRQTKE